MMNIAACIVGMQQVGTRRTVAAVILIASDSASTKGTKAQKMIIAAVVPFCG
jgi:hypothetical protein